MNISDKVREKLIHAGWKVSKAISTAQGHAIIARGTCPGCAKAWSTAHRKCVPGLFPAKKGD